MFKKICIVNGNELKIDEMEFHLDDLVKKILKDKKVPPKKEVDIRIKQRLLDKLHHKVKILDRGEVLPFIDIPETMQTKEHGELVFRIDKDKGTIRVLRRVYEWDSDKDDIDDE